MPRARPERAPTVGPARRPASRSARASATRGRARDEVRAAKRRLTELARSKHELGQRLDALCRRIVAVERRARGTVASGGNERAHRVLERNQTAVAELQRIEMLLAQLDADRLAAGAQLARPVRWVPQELTARIERMEDTVERLQARMLAIAALLDDVSSQRTSRQKGK